MADGIRFTAKNYTNIADLMTNGKPVLLYVFSAVYTGPAMNTRHELGDPILNMSIYMCPFTGEAYCFAWDSTYGITMIGNLRGYRNDLASRFISDDAVKHLTEYC